jgi:hypothetical protein
VDSAVGRKRRWPVEGWHGWVGTSTRVALITVDVLPLAALAVWVLAGHRSVAGTTPGVAEVAGRGRGRVRGPCVFAVDDIDDVIAPLRTHGAKLVCIRGPAGIIVALAEELG